MVCALGWTLLLPLGLCCSVTPGFGHRSKHLDWDGDAGGWQQWTP